MALHVREEMIHPKATPRKEIGTQPVTIYVGHSITASVTLSITRRVIRGVPQVYREHDAGITLCIYVPWHRHDAKRTVSVTTIVKGALR